MSAFRPKQTFAATLNLSPHMGKSRQNLGYSRPLLGGLKA